MNGQMKHRPNVVVVLVDDQGYGDLSCHGHPVLRTPELDRLHGDSVCLTDFHVSPMCTPTRGSLLTGLDALRHGAVNVSSGRAMLRTDLPLLPEVLTESGYRTALFGKWHLGDTYPYRPQDRGFEHVEWFPSSHIGSAPDHWEADYFDPWLKTTDGEIRTRGYCTDVFTDRAIDWMGERVEEGESFFAYLALNAPHIPRLVPDSYREPYRQHGSPEQVSHFAMVASIDENIGKLRAALTDWGIAEDTIVIFASDNGGAAETVRAYDAGMRGTKTQLWEGGHRVPFLIQWTGGGIGGPGQGREVGTLSVATDVLPTLLNLCDLPVDAIEGDGTDISPLLRNPSEGDATRLIAELDERVSVIQYSRMNTERPEYGDAAVLQGPWRLLDDRELYHVGRDPGQTEDVASAHPEVVTRLRQHYRQWWDGLGEDALDFLDVVVGTDHEPHLLLSPAEWRGVALDRQLHIRAGVRRNGVWGVHVATPGRYRFTLRRWPAESGLPMRAAAPEVIGGDCVFEAGVALPIAETTIRIGDHTQTHAVGDQDQASVVEVDLPAGSTTMQTWLKDSAGNELSGAYYAYVQRV
ncbi:arylsulfatase [Ruania alba]|uniref:Arylsulfatase n=1 Tax=Ruania alba TaxID=648782 RepID=A0A1H5N9B6_9MICO|nr:arylsulfatase [Ruania alba]SEE97457.1 arylsulfatase [Ruania alba]